MAITLAQAETQLALWIAADAALATAQSYRIGERQLTRADAEQVRANITYWENRVMALSDGRSRGMRVRYGEPG
ncbi:MAG: hypothetical protein Dbin4_02873 [Alphaproteobacteria bacterium]|nr:hypothetical protein [Alphaproteobacteria bacterium]